ncbi:hypothetical protein EDB81DRAFT_190640 [Dactylonectria macrodidyma]|uniref:C2H2-type domain-containing protein n=1 Tax=Dactylonectria macrodidyma TaxID=307937 RepID=A0A9P9FPJ9_9HYPO|nr:hypothetical protein EDB81DRAFT_190640 [Dactylonectria macrodidyma]
MDHSMSYQVHGRMQGMEGIDLEDGINDTVNLSFDAAHNFQMGLDPMAGLQTLNWNHQSLNHAQMLPPADFIMPWSPEAQWIHQPHTWGIASDSQQVPNIGMAGQPAFNGGATYDCAAYDDGASIACSSHCDVNCVSHCDEADNTDANCCFDASCVDVDMNHSVCCFDDSCGMPEPCLDDNCTDSGHTCTDANCMVPTVQTTPASAGISTPPAFGSDGFVSLEPPMQSGLDGDLMNTTSNPETGEDTTEYEYASVCHWLGEDGTLCDHSFENQEQLQAHCKDHHLKDLKKTPGSGFYCSWSACTRKTPFSQKSKLERHMQTHTGYKPVRCDICGMYLSAKQSLEQHKRTHSGEKPWVCTFPGCEQAFKQQSALTMHIRTHTGEKPLQCEICGKWFGESSNLSKHRRTHNVRGGHSCQFCDKNFHRLDQLRRHMKSTHADQCKVPEPGWCFAG